MSDRLARLGLFGMAAALWSRMAGCNGEDERKTPKEPAGKDVDANLPDAVWGGDAHTAPTDAGGSRGVDAGDITPPQYDSYVTSCENLPPEETGLKINEVLFDPEGDDAGKEWVELFNKSSQSININGYTLTNNSAATLLTLPNISIPACSYYVAHLPNEILDNTQDAVALFSGEASADTIVDFLAYSAVGMIEEGHAFAMAKAAGIWREGDFVDVAGVSGDPSFIRVVSSEGESIGRDRDSTDTNTSADWAPLGGVNSFGTTPETANFFPILFQEAVQEIPVQPKKDWSFLIYMAADSDLEAVGFKDLNVLERVGSPSHVHVGVLADFATRDLNPQTRNTIENSAYIHIQKDEGDRNENRLASTIQLIPEVNTGDPKTLSDFLTWGTEKLPADRYYLVIWGHGNGWKGTAWDFSNRTAIHEANNDRLNMGELRAGLAGGPTADVLSFYSCLMGGMEVAHQVQEKAKYVAFSEEVLWGGSWGTWPWDTIITQMEQTPNMTAEALARLTVRGANQALAGFPHRTLSAIKLEGEDFFTLVTKTSEFAATLKRGLEDWGEGNTKHDDREDNVQTRIKKMLNENPRVEYFTFLNRGNFGGPAPDYRDLFDFARRVEGDAKIVAGWKEKAKDVREGVEKVVIENLHGGDHPNAHGLSVYFPRAHTTEENGALISADLVPFDLPLSAVNQGRQLYAADTDPTAPANHPLAAATMRFTTATQWDEFLHRYYNPVADPSCRSEHSGMEEGKSYCQSDVNNPVTLRAVGSSDSDGKLEKYIWDFYIDKNDDDEDYDKDNDDGPDDDKNAEGREVDFSCPEEKSYTIRLMVWDDHYNVNSQRSGDHRRHYQIDDETVTVDCIQPQ